MEIKIDEETSRSLLVFWHHMMTRISRDANIQYYCGAMTETLRLGIEVYKKLNPLADPVEYKRALLSSKVSLLCDRNILMGKIEESR